MTPTSSPATSENASATGSITRLYHHWQLPSPANRPATQNQPLNNSNPTTNRPCSSSSESYSSPTPKTATCYPTAPTVNTRTTHSNTKPSVCLPGVPLPCTPPTSPPSGRRSTISGKPSPKVMLNGVSHPTTADYLTTIPQPAQRDTPESFITHQRRLRTRP